MDLNRPFDNRIESRLIDNNTSNLLSTDLKDDATKFDVKYKTELCQKFENTGKCPYGSKCRFAHGKEELISKQLNVNYKKKPCKTFTEKGYCPYGSRCSFRHDERTFFDVSFSYYYLKHFILKYANFLEGLEKNNSHTTQILVKRLPIFESITANNSIISSGNNQIFLNFANENNSVNDMVTMRNIGSQNL